MQTLGNSGYNDNKLFLFSVACACNLVLPTYYDPPLLLSLSLVKYSEMHSLSYIDNAD